MLGETSILRWMCHFSVKISEPGKKKRAINEDFLEFWKILRIIFLHKLFSFENQRYNCQTSETNRIQHRNVVFEVSSSSRVIFRKSVSKTIL